MKKLFSIILICLLSVSLIIGCSNKEDDKKARVSSDFKSDKAQEISDQYLDLLCEGKISKANELLSNELKEKTANSLGDTVIVSYTMEKVVEASDNAAMVYNIIRVKEDNVRADRDTITIRVKQNGDNYEITEVKATNKNQVYSKGDNLRFVGEEGGDSQLILNINNLHMDIYPKDQGAMIEKDKIPHDKFGVVTLSYSGRRVALTTTDGTNNFIAVVDIDEGLVANSPVTDNGSEGNAQSNSTEQASEKSIAKKIIPLDILKVENVEKLIFTSDEEKLVVQYIENEKERIKIYTSSGGELVKTKIDEDFPSEEYSIKFVGLEKKLVKFKAINASGEKTYTIDLEDNEIKEK